MPTTRRDFLKGALGASAVLSFGGTVPRFLAAAAAAEAEPTADTVLVVVQLSGGNDGLNTVVPFADDVYRKKRPKLAIPADKVLKLDDRLGLHPSLTGLRDLFDRGELGIVQGVGYPQPNRSHFESMDIWHTCRRKADRRNDGWLGRFLDASVKGDGGDVPALHLGDEKQPLALAADHVRVPSVASLDRFRLQASDAELTKAVADLTAAERPKGNDLLDFVETSTTGALAASRRVESARGAYATKAEYPDTDLASKLRTVAQLIDAGLGTRIYYVTLDGFDTHSQQADAHTALLSQFGGAVGAFVRDVTEHGHGKRVLVTAFSEFGRRVEENASGGTDHGAAAPMFLAGGRVKPGLIGALPSLTDLEDGDLKFHTDFRQVYAAILERWLRWPSASVLGEEWKPADVIA
jgi:uncharacterized protein (DUF1501 family)